MTTTTKVRLRFAKRGDLRLVSHHDLMRTLERMLRRAQVPMASSHGFNPRPRITFALALGLGIEGRGEIVDLELSVPMEPSQLLDRLRAVAPAGLDWKSAQALPADAPPPRVRSVEYDLTIPQPYRQPARLALESLLASEAWPLIRRRPNREQPFDLRPHLLEAEINPEGVLRFRLKVLPDGSARPEEFLEALALRDLLDHGAIVARTRVDLDS
jgi:radical SAM-linked protein